MRKRNGRIFFCHDERGLWLSESRESWFLRGDRGARCRDATPVIGDINAIGVVNPPTPAPPLTLHVRLVQSGEGTLHLTRPGRRACEGKEKGWVNSRFLVCYAMLCAKLCRDVC